MNLKGLGFVSRLNIFNTVYVREINKGNTQWFMLRGY
jgi:hypothetical protein